MAELENPRRVLSETINRHAQTVAESRVIDALAS